MMVSDVNEEFCGRMPFETRDSDSVHVIHSVTHPSVRWSSTSFVDGPPSAASSLIKHNPFIQPKMSANRFGITFQRVDCSHGAHEKDEHVRRSSRNELYKDRR